MICVYVQVWMLKKSSARYIDCLLMFSEPFMLDFKLETKMNSVVGIAIIISAVTLVGMAAVAVNQHLYMQ